MHIYLSYMHMLDIYSNMIAFIWAKPNKQKVPAPSREQGQNHALSGFDVLVDVDDG